MKRIIVPAILIFFIILSSGCGETRESVIPSDAEYLVIFSDMIQPEGGYFYINDIGDTLGKTNNLKMQDLICHDVSEERIILSGERKNNTLIFDKGSPEFKKNFVFLNNSSFSGLTAVTSREECLIGIMNGNFSGDSYLNLLVLQSMNGDIIHQLELEIFAHKVIDVDDHAIVTGCHISNNNEGMFLSAELLDYHNKNVEEHKYEIYNCFWDIVFYESSYYCLVENKNGNKNTIVSIDANDFSVKEEIVIQDQLSSLFVHDGKLYAAGDLGIYEIDLKSKSSDTCVQFTEVHSPEESAYVDFSYYLDGHAYIFMRYSQRKQMQNIYEYGYILKIDINNYNVSETPVIHPKRSGLNNIFIIPVSFLR